MIHTPQFNASKFEHKLIEEITERAVKLADELGHEINDVKMMMDLTACHCNGCPLDLNKLLNAPNGDFGHDVFGIRRHINRRTGQLEDCFQPRCAMQDNA